MCAASPWEVLRGDAADLVGATARAALDDPGEVLAAADAEVLDAASPLAAYPELAAQARASTHANIIRWLTSTAQRPGARVGHDVAPEALEVARDVVRRGFDRQLLETAYRRGQNAAWRHWMGELSVQAASSPTWSAVLLEALDATARSLFGFVDDVLVTIEERIERERDELLSGSLALRQETVQLILEGAPISQRRATERLGYELAGDHVGLVLWTTDPAPEHDLEGVATRLATAGGLRSPVRLTTGLTGLWGWAAAPAAPAAPDVAAMRSALDAEPPAVHAAVGSVAAGIAGFRQSHREALEAQRLATGQRLTVYEEVEVAVLAGADAERAAGFVRAVLGPLLDERPELRETLRVFLEEHRSATHAARRLFTHRNTVLNRVARAETLLPRPLAEHTLAVAVALELDRWAD